LADKPQEIGAGQLGTGLLTPDSTPKPEQLSMIREAQREQAGSLREVHSTVKEASKLEAT